MSSINRSEWQLHTPVVFIIYNRPDTTERVFAEIAKAKPSQLLVVADGPRTDRPGDVEKSAAARAIIERVHWDCEVLKNYSDVNLGCGRRPATGISWAFEQVDTAIILEDDCVPHPTFFRFCEELLERYRDDERIMQICGNNFQFGTQRDLYSYIFSRHNLCWGWASWRRAWQHFDIGAKLWPTVRDSRWLVDIVGHSEAAEHWRESFERAYTHNGNTDYWDYQWTFACWIQNGLSVLPNVTLVSNIGCREDATHTKSPNSIIANIRREAMEFPLRHPPYMISNPEAGAFFIEQVVLPLIRKNKPKASPQLRRGLSSVVPMCMRDLISRVLSFLSIRG